MGNTKKVLQSLDFLDPTNGYIWSRNAIKNYYIYGPEDSLITKLLIIIFRWKY